MNQPIYPAATADNMPLLAKLLADRGVEIRVDGGGTLQVRDVDKRLTAADRATVRHYAEPLAAWLRSAEHPHKTSHLKRTESESPDAPRCDRCRSSDYRDVSIHDGQSSRRDCARCGRTWGFPRWYGEQGRQP